MWKTITFFTLFGYTFAEQIAVAYLRDPTGSNNVTGSVTFTKTSEGIVVTGTIIGLAAGNHGFHIHNLGNIYPDCAASGGHFNPENDTHGAPNDTNRHVGDLGNIVATDSVNTTINISDTIIDLEGSHNIIGRALVVHEGEDDLGKGEGESLVNGNAGGRLACGVIGILEEEETSSSNVFVASYVINVAVLSLIYGIN